jgi:hypothetical protein
MSLSEERKISFGSFASLFNRSHHISKRSGTLPANPSNILTSLKTKIDFVSKNKVCFDSKRQGRLKSSPGSAASSSSNVSYLSETRLDDPDYKNIWLDVSEITLFIKLYLQCDYKRTLLICSDAVLAISELWQQRNQDFTESKCIQEILSRWFELTMGMSTNLDLPLDLQWMGANFQLVLVHLFHDNHHSLLALYPQSHIGSGSSSHESQNPHKVFLFDPMGNSHESYARQTLQLFSTIGIITKNHTLHVITNDPRHSQIGKQSDSELCGYYTMLYANALIDHSQLSASIPSSEYLALSTSPPALYQLFSHFKLFCDALVQLSSKDIYGDFQLTDSMEFTSNVARESLSTLCYANILSYIDIAVPLSAYGQYSIPSNSVLLTKLMRKEERYLQFSTLMQSIVRSIVAKSSAGILGVPGGESPAIDTDILSVITITNPVDSSVVSFETYMREELATTSTEPTEAWIEQIQEERAPKFAKEKLNLFHYLMRRLSLLNYIACRNRLPIRTRYGSSEKREIILAKLDPERFFRHTTLMMRIASAILVADECILGKSWFRVTSNPANQLYSYLKRNTTANGLLADAINTKDSVKQELNRLKLIEETATDELERQKLIEETATETALEDEPQQELETVDIDHIRNEIVNFEEELRDIEKSITTLQHKINEMGNENFYEQYVMYQSHTIEPLYTSFTDPNFYFASELQQHYTPKADLADTEPEEYIANARYTVRHEQYVITINGKQVGLHRLALLFTTAPHMLKYLSSGFNRTKPVSYQLTVNSIPEYFYVPQFLSGISGDSVDSSINPVIKPSESALQYVEQFKNYSYYNHFAYSMIKHAATIRTSPSINHLLSIPPVFPSTHSEDSLVRSTSNRWSDFWEKRATRTSREFRELAVQGGSKMKITDACICQAVVDCYRCEEELIHLMKTSKTQEIHKLVEAAGKIPFCFKETGFPSTSRLFSPIDFLANKATQKSILTNSVALGGKYEHLASTTSGLSVLNSMELFAYDTHRLPAYVSALPVLFSLSNGNEYILCLTDMLRATARHDKTSLKDSFFGSVLCMALLGSENRQRSQQYPYDQSRSVLRAPVVSDNNSSPLIPLYREVFRDRAYDEQHIISFYFIARLLYNFLSQHNLSGMSLDELFQRLRVKMSSGGFIELISSFSTRHGHTDTPKYNEHQKILILMELAYIMGF